MELDGSFTFSQYISPAHFLSQKLQILLLQNSTLGAFAKLRKTTISFIMSVCSSKSKNSAPTEWVFMKFEFQDFSKICREKFKCR